METSNLVPPNDLSLLGEWMKQNLNIKEFVEYSPKPVYPYMYIPMAKNVDQSIYWSLCEKAVCRKMGITVDQLKEVSKVTEIMLGRQMVWYFFHKKHENVSLKTLGARYGKTHATALNGIKKVRHFIETDKGFRALIYHIQQELAI